MFLRGLVAERGGRVPTEGGGRSAQAGKRKTLPETRGRAHGEEKGDTCPQKSFSFQVSFAAHVKALFTLQRLEEIMKRTRRSDTAEKVTYL